jgi:uncharacterized membrane protein YcaP (DUF421 family)
LEAVLHGLAIYTVLILVFRLAGRRRMEDASISDLLLLIVLGEGIQQALKGRESQSLVVMAVLVVLLIGLIRISDFLGVRARRDDARYQNGPIVLVEDGEPLPEQMVCARVTEQDILNEARRAQGLERMEQIKYAVLDKTGDIAVVPRY